MSVGYDKAILRKMEQDPSYSYDMHFKDFSRMYKHYSDEEFDSGKSLINYGGMSAPRPVQHVPSPSAPKEAPETTSDSGGSGGGSGTEELLEQADIDALLAQMQ